MKTLNKRILCLVLGLCMWSVLTGSDFLDVGIKGSDKGPLVDLGQIISIGGSFTPSDNVFEEITESGETDDTALKEEREGEAEGTEASKVNVRTAIELVIYGRDIYIDSVKMPGERSVRSKLEYCAKNNISVMVNDSYAELYTRKNVYEMIEETGAKTPAGAADE